MTRTYRAGLQISLHDAPNPVDPIGATDWGGTRASAYAGVEVDLNGEILTRSAAVSLTADRDLPVGAVWALFVDQWGQAKPVHWARLAVPAAAGAVVELAAGDDQLTIDGSFAVRNVARSTATPSGLGALVGAVPAAAGTPA